MIKIQITAVVFGTSKGRGKEGENSGWAVRVGTVPLLLFHLLLGQIPDTQNEGRKGLFSSKFVEVSVHIRLAQG